MLRKRLSLWQLSLFCLLLMASICASVMTDSPTIHAQSAVNSRLLGNNPVFTQATSRASRVLLQNKQLTAKTAHVASKTVHVTAVTTDPACTSATVSGTTTTNGAVAFTEYTIPTASTRPYTVAQSGGTVWFVENAANEIGRLSTSGNTTTITQCPVPTANANLQGITIGPAGSVWFTEAGTDKVGNIAISGTTATFNEFSVAAGAFPVNITGGPDGNLWFTEQNLSQIGRITPTGTLTETAVPTANSGPLGIVTIGTGTLWFTEPWVDQLGSITTAATPVVTEYTGVTAGSFPFGITAGPTVSGANTVWFTEPDTNKIGQVTVPATGTAVTVNETAVPTANSNPNFIASFNGTGTLAFNEQSGNNTSTITTGTTPAVKEYAIPTANATPIGMTNGGANTVWLAESAANKIAKMSFRSGNLL